MSYDRPTRYGAIKGPKHPETRHRDLFGFVESGRFGPEVRLVTECNGLWLKARKITFADQDGNNEVTLELPKFGLDVFLDKGVRIVEDQDCPPDDGW